MSDSPRFEIGDVVQLKSGGEGMTVLSTVDGQATCNYWDFNARQLRTAMFPEQMLMYYPSPEEQRDA